MSVPYFPARWLTFQPGATAPRFARPRQLRGSSLQSVLSLEFVDASSRTAGKRYVERGHHDGVLSGCRRSVLSPELPAMISQRPWRPQRPRAAPLLAYSDAVRRLASDQLARPRDGRDHVEAGRDEVPLARRWFDAGTDVHREVCLSFPASLNSAFVDGCRLEHLLPGSAAAREQHIGALCRVATVCSYFHGRHHAGLSPER